MNKKNLLISFAVISLTAGLLLLFYKPFLEEIISLLGYLLHKKLDFQFWRIGFTKTGVELVVLFVNISLGVLFFKKNSEGIILFSCLLWILVFVAYVISNAVNFPLGDDYIFFLQFLNNYSSTKDILSIVQQHPTDESRMILIHLIAIGFFYLNALNFKTLLFISTTCLTGIALLFYRSIQAKQKALLFLTLVFFIFQFQYYDSVVHVSSALTHACAIFFAFYSLYLLNKSSLIAFIASLFFTLLSILNHGCGFVVVICGVILLICQKGKKYLWTWTIFFLSSIILYSINYQFIGDIAFTDFPFLGQRIFSCFLFSCAFLGSSFQFLYQETLPIIIGGIIWLYFLSLTIKKYYQKNPVIYFLLLFLICTSCLPSLFRSEQDLHYASALSIRYGIYSMMAICCCIIILFETNIVFKNKHSLISYFLVFSFLYHISTNLFFYPEMVLRRERLITSIQYLKQKILSEKSNGKTDKQFSSPDSIRTKEDEETIIKESILKNIYKLPDE